MKSSLSRLGAVTFIAGLSALALAGCTTDMRKLNVLKSKAALTPTEQDGEYLQLTRKEVADQGAGKTVSLIGPGGHTFTRVTVGGSYLRRKDPASPGYKLKSGLHDTATGTR